MSKTPEELAEEYSKVNTSLVGGALGSYRQGLFEGFLDGYEAGMNSPEKPDSCEHILDMEKMVDADKVTPKQDVTLLHKVANNYLDRKAAKYRRVCGYKK